MISVDEAQATVLGRTPVLPAETAPLDAARGRVLRAAVSADRDLPPFDRAAMDGFAVRSADVSAPNTRLRVIGDIRAGTWPDRPMGALEAFRIMTGAPVPEGADAVVQVERTKMADPGSGGGIVVLVETSVAAGQNLVRRGSEASAGMVLLHEGVRLGAAHLAVLASVGTGEPLVSRRPRVALLVTGDEVIDFTGSPARAQIRNANGVTLLSAIADAGGVACDFGIVPDDPVKTRAAIARAFEEGHDAVVLSGGVSAGDFDFVEAALLELGVTLHVTSVRVKPGAPFVFGTRGDTLIFGLPGNPVSAQVTFELFVRPALLSMQGAAACHRPLVAATLEGSLTNRSGRRNYLPVWARWAEGELRARSIRTQGSGDVAAHSLANALAVIEPERIAVAAGERIFLYPFSSLLEV